MVIYGRHADHSAGKERKKDPRGGGGDLEKNGHIVSEAV